MRSSSAASHYSFPMLWMLRHADAADGSPDDERPLTARGVAQAQNAGRALQRLGVGIDACLSSPKLRAVQTAQHACAPLGVPVTADRRLSGEPFDVDDLVTGLGDVLIVGHDPSFTLLLHDLTGAQARMRKGGLAAIHKGELITLLRPAELAAIALGEPVRAARRTRPAAVAGESDDSGVLPSGNAGSRASPMPERERRQA